MNGAADWTNVSIATPDQKEGWVSEGGAEGDAISWMGKTDASAPVSYTHLTLPTTPYV